MQGDILYPDLDENQKNNSRCDSILFLLFMHVKHTSKCVEMKNDTLELVLRSDPNLVAQNTKQSCVLFCLNSTYKKVGEVELHHTQDQSEHINKFDEADEDTRYPDLTSAAHSC